MLSSSSLPVLCQSLPAFPSTSDYTSSSIDVNDLCKRTVSRAVSSSLTMAGVQPPPGLHRWCFIWHRRSEQHTRKNQTVVLLCGPIAKLAAANPSWEYRTPDQLRNRLHVFLRPARMSGRAVSTVTTSLCLVVCSVPAVCGRRPGG